MSIRNHARKILKFGFGDQNEANPPFQRGQGGLFKDDSKKTSYVQHSE